MSDSPICILLAAYNGCDYLNQQLESIFSQTADCDIYISVDKSSDNTFLYAKEIAERNENVFVLPYGERYGSAGQNFLRLLLEVDISAYDNIAFSDQDDVWFDFKIKHALDMISFTGAEGYSSNVTAFWPDGRTKLVKKDYTQANYDYIFESAGPGCTFVMTRKLALAIKQSLINNKDNIQKIWLHDWYCYAFARSRGFKWYIDSKPTMAYRQHAGNEVGANSGWKSFKSRVVSILSGDGIVKAVNQASFLDLQDTLPVKLLCSGHRTDLIKLAFLANRCRRKPVDKVMFFIIFIWFAARGLPLGKR